MSEQLVFRTVIDLTHPLNDHSPNWEGTSESPFHAHELGNIERDGYYSRIFSTQEHYGTHLDAPAHFAAGAWTVEEIPVDRLVRPMVVLDVRSNVNGNGDYEVRIEDVSRFEHLHGKISSGSVAVAYTGWDAHWQRHEDFRNEQQDGLPHYPGFSLDAAKFLVESRGVVGLGIDTMSVDIGATTTYPVHVFTSQHRIFHLENVANLAQVPPVGATIIVAPIKLESGSGAPARVLALV